MLSYEDGSVRLAVGRVFGAITVDSDGIYILVPYCLEFTSFGMVFHRFDDLYCLCVTR